MRLPRRTLTALAGAAVAVALLPAADSAADTTWLCLPGQVPNPCKETNATTHISSSGVATVDNPPFAKRPKVDCFFVYPTVSGQSGANADLSIDPELIAIARYQAARFSEVCRVYAPVYRQLTVGSIFAPPDDPAAAARVAYGDVRAAWKEYLRSYNRGRGVVLIGHSQGAGMLQVLARKQIDARPGIRERLVSALLLGGNVTVADGSDVGGSFRHIPACRAPSQLGCVVAYSTYGAPPPDNARFGKSANRFAAVFGIPQGANLEVLCNNPAALAGGPAPLSTLSRTESFPGFLGVGLLIMYAAMPPTAPTPWIEPQDHFAGECIESNGANVLMLTPIAGARVPLPSPTPDWGLHLTDVNIALGDLVTLVRGQAAEYVKRTRR